MHILWQCLPSQPSNCCRKIIDLSVKPNIAHIFCQLFTVPWEDRDLKCLVVTGLRFVLSSAVFRGFIKLSHVGRWACPADMWFWGKCSHHMIWSEVNTWSSVVSWRAEPFSDNRPDGQRTGKAWLSKQHMTPTNIFVCLCLFVPFMFSDSLCHSALKCVTLSSPQQALLPSLSVLSAPEIFFLNYWFVVGICSIASLSVLSFWWPESNEKGCWISFLSFFILGYSHLLLLRCLLLQITDTLLKNQKEKVKESSSIFI